MRSLAILAVSMLAFSSWGCAGPPGSTVTGITPSGSGDNIPAPTSGDNTGPDGIPLRRPAAPGGGAITGFAFVDSSVTGQGARGKLPAGTKIYPPGSTVTGTDGCPTTRYRTDGQLVAVIDYTGRPTAGSVTITEHVAARGEIQRAPYYLDLDAGRTLQFLGPIFDNGTYDLLFQYDFSLGQGQKSTATITLARNCPAAR